MIQRKAGGARFPESGSMKHAVIIAHPAGSSFTASVAQTYARAAEGLGHRAVVRDLYRMQFDPRLKAEEIPGSPNFKPAPDVTAERAEIGDCDVFALFYPLWLNAPPAMLKGYLDRVFGFGFAYGGAGRSYNPLLKGRRLISFTSSGAPSTWLEETGAMEAVHTLFDRYLADLCGLTLVDHVHFGAVVPGASAFFVQARLSEVTHAVATNFGECT